MAPQQQQFKIDVFWNQYNQQVATRVLRDCLAIQRLAKVNRANFIVACDQDVHPTLEAMGIPVTSDFVNPNMVRAYLVNSDMTEELDARLPECEDLELINLNPLPMNNTSDNPPGVSDPYAGVKLFVDWKAIPETMPLTKQPPKGPADPMWSPWL